MIGGVSAPPFFSLMDAVSEFLKKKDDKVRKYEDMVNSMLSPYGKYRYAFNTLRGILDYIEKNNSISEAQIQAIENIKAKPYGR